MSISSALLVFSILAAATGMAHAAACSDEIAQLEQVAAQSEASPASEPTAAQSLGAQLHHQPTPQSVQQATRHAKVDISGVLAHAKALAAEGKDAECMQAVGEAKRILELD